MGTRLRPWTTYKAFGGVLAVLGLPASILVALGDTPPGGGPAAPLTAAALPGLLGLAGLYVFLASDRAVKRIEAASPKTVRPHVTASTTRVSRPEPTTSFRRTESHRSTTPAQAHDCADIRGVCGSAASAPSRCVLWQFQDTMPAPSAIMNIRAYRAVRASMSGTRFALSIRRTSRQAGESDTRDANAPAGATPAATRPATTSGGTSTLSA